MNEERFNYFCATLQLRVWREFFKRDMLRNRFPGEESLWSAQRRMLCAKVHP